MHGLCRPCNIPPTVIEVGAVMGMSGSDAAYRINRACLHGWLRTLPRGWRRYVTPWYVEGAAWANRPL